MERLRPTDTILFLGEGNFSFSLCVSKTLKKQAGEEHIIRVTATCYEPEPVSQVASENIARLRDLGVNVKLGVDCTRLHEQQELPANVEKVIFMFPHVGGKMNIKKNRRLLRDLGVSVSRLVPPPEQLLVALCAGQGGSEHDSVRRKEGDHWQAAKMLAFGGFLLAEVSPLNLENLLGYSSFGYRSLNKGFHTEGARLHVFRLNPCRVFEMARRGENFLERAQQRFEKWCKTNAEDATCESCEEVALVPTLQWLETLPEDLGSGQPFRERLRCGSCGKDVELEASRSPFDPRADSEGSSVSPPEYHHDLSFWLPSDSRALDSEDLLGLLWSLGGDFVCAFSWVEGGFVRDGRRSQTVRLGYRARWFAMSPEVAWRLHTEVVGGAIRDKFKATLRL